MDGCITMTPPAYRYRPMYTRYTRAYHCRLGCIEALLGVLGHCKGIDKCTGMDTGTGKGIGNGKGKDRGTGAQ